MLSLTGGIYLGWALGANDAANLFGTAVASRIISFRRATLLCAIFLVIGAWAQGSQGIRTLSHLTQHTPLTLWITSLAAAVVVSGLTLYRLPISTSQAVIGSITGIGLASGSMAWDGLVKVLICWIAAPVGGVLIAAVLYRGLGLLLRRLRISILTRDKLLWGGLVLVGIYGSYSLGANNVANATGIFSGQFPGVTDTHLALLGGVAIAAGVLTFSRRVMWAVGSGLMQLDAFCAFVAVLASAITVHVLAVIGVPVSASQAVVGAIMGIGLMRGIHSLHLPVLRRMYVAWLLTPVLSLVLAAAAYAILMGMQTAPG